MNECVKKSADYDSDDVRFDRLVDGELSAEEYLALVASLDDEPGGWRRCALAFLESQALASELGGVRQLLDFRNSDSERLTISHGSGRSSKPLHSRPAGLWTLLAMAASLLVAFALGIAVPRPLQVQDQPLAGNQPSGQRPAAVRHEALRPVGDVRLVMTDASGEPTQAGRLPVYEAEQAARFLTQHRPALPSELIDLLEQRGHRIQRQQQYLPVELDDGRQIIVPVEGYQITPVSRRAY